MSTRVVSITIHGAHAAPLQTRLRVNGELRDLPAEVHAGDVLQVEVQGTATMVDASVRIERTYT